MVDQEWDVVRTIPVEGDFFYVLWYISRFRAGIIALRYNRVLTQLIDSNTLIELMPPQRKASASN